LLFSNLISVEVWESTEGKQSKFGSFEPRRTQIKINYFQEKITTKVEILTSFSSPLLKYHSNTLLSNSRKTTKRKRW